MIDDSRSVVLAVFSDLLTWSGNVKNKPQKLVSLCPECSACPAVEIYAGGTVRIGEEPNIVTLSTPEWNELVRAVQRGELTELVAGT